MFWSAWKVVSAMLDVSIDYEANKRLIKLDIAVNPFVSEWLSLANQNWNSKFIIFFEDSIAPKKSLLNCMILLMLYAADVCLKLFAYCSLCMKKKAQI